METLLSPLLDSHLDPVPLSAPRRALYGVAARAIWAGRPPVGRRDRPQSRNWEGGREEEEIQFGAQI